MTQDKIDMSLDDIIAKTKGKGGAGGRGGGQKRGGGGGGRGGGGARRGGGFRSRSRSTGMPSTTFNSAIGVLYFVLGFLNLLEMDASDNQASD